jgi:hypothetical protein
MSRGSVSRPPYWRLALAVTAILFWSAIAGCGVVPNAADPLSGPTAPAFPAKNAPAHPAWQSSARLGSKHSGAFVVYNNAWNASAAGPQTIWADSYHYWGVESEQSATTAVKTYPCVQMIYDNVPYTSVKGLTSTFSELMPSDPSLYAEAAYDIWLNNYKVEVMIWVDNHRHNPSANVIGHVELGGQPFALWSGGPDMYSFVLTGRQENTGKINVLTFLQWLVAHGYLHATDTMTQVDFGWEIASTGGVYLDFLMKDYSLTTQLSG